MNNYLFDSRVFDMYRIPPPSYVTQDYLDDTYSQGEPERSVAVFQSIHKVEIGFRLLDLKRKTESRVFSLFEANKLATLPKDLDYGSGQNLPLILISEMYGGFKLVSRDTEQAVVRLRLPKEEEDINNQVNQILLLSDLYEDGLRLLSCSRQCIKLYTLAYTL